MAAQQPFGADAGPTEWAAWYDEYLTRAAGQSARVSELYQDVMACVSRGELKPTVLQDMLPPFLQARGEVYATELAHLSMGFFSGLVQLGTQYSYELVDTISPGAMATSSAVPPQLDATDWNGWYQQLLDYANRQGAQAGEAFRTLVERVAAGDLATEQMQQASSRFAEQRAPEHLRTLLGLCFDLLNGLNEIRARPGEDFLEGVLATATRAGEQEAFALDLYATLGTTTSASLSIANTRAETSLVRCSVSSVRRADGVGPAFEPNAAITPEAITLAPGEETTVVLSVLVAAHQYEIDRLYVGTLHVAGHDADGLDVPLRIRAGKASQPEIVDVASDEDDA